MGSLHLRVGNCWSPPMMLKMRCLPALFVIGLSAAAHADQLQRTTVASIAGRISNGSYMLVASGGLIATGQAVGGAFAESDGFLAPGGPPPLAVPWDSGARPERTRVVVLGSNPFKARVACVFEVATPADEGATQATMEVFDPTGRRVSASTRSLTSPGRYLFEWNGMDNEGVRLSPGLYLVRFRAGRQVRAARLILLD